MLKQIVRIFIVALLGVVVFSACQIKYNFTGSKPMVLEKTFTVYYFPNRARLINPTLSQSFTEQLREKLQRQTSLDEISENGDIEFEGQITGYDFRPMSIQKEDLSAQTRLTVTIKLKYTNHKVPDDSFEKTFSAYEDFDSNLPISSVEDELIVEIIKKLNDDIFNATIASW
uniref:LptE family protein n=1 Tax=uncultured Draconibacterium sp. TaxID=1573823 RepID=UPI003216D9D2